MRHWAKNSNLIEIPYNRSICSSRGIVRLSLAIQICHNINVVRKVHWFLVNTVQIFNHEHYTFIANKWSMEITSNDQRNNSTCEIVRPTRQILNIQIPHKSDSLSYINTVYKINLHLATQSNFYLVKYTSFICYLSKILPSIRIVN